MKIELDNPQALSLERKIKMHEAREGIIDRLARDLPTNIDLERFLNVVVSEIGRMLEADRCDLLAARRRQGAADQPRMATRQEDPVESRDRSFRSIAKKLSEQFDVTKPIRINDTSKSKDPTLKFFAKALGTRSLLIIPIMLSGEVLGLLGLHDTHAAARMARRRSQLSRIHRPSSSPSVINTRASTSRRNRNRSGRMRLLEIANTLNSHSDFNEVSSTRAGARDQLVGADYGALGVLDKTGKRISLASFKSAEGVKPNTRSQDGRGARQVAERRYVSGASAN